MKIIETSSKIRGPLSDNRKIEIAEKLKKLQKEGEKMVKGVFEFVDAQGGWLDFSYRWYPGEPIRTVKITHGEMIDIPLDVAKHLNNIYKKIRVPKDNLDSGQKDYVTKLSRTRFTPIDMLAA